MKALAILLLSQSLVFSYGFLRNQWIDYYDVGTNMQSIGCQACHVQTSGGSPWNAYGWAVRQEYLSNGRDLIAAFTAVENDNSDGSADGSSNLLEIQADSPPGWTSGNENSWFYASFTVSTNNPPPILSINLDLPSGVDFNTWISSFYPGETDPEIIGKMADPNEDGIQNLLCFYLGTDPRIRSSENCPQISYSGAHVIITHQRNISNAVGLIGGIEYDTELSSAPWDKAEDNVDGVSIQVIANYLSSGLETVQYTIPKPSDGRLFSRIYVNE